MWQNTGFMLKTAWEICRSVPFLVVILAAVTAGKTTAEMLIAPVLLGQVEEKVPLWELVWSIVGFSALLFLLSGLCAYLTDNSLFGRITVRLNLLRRIDTKVAETSYPNTLDNDFINSEDKALHSCSSNSQATESIWRTWTDILTNVIGFIVYLLLLSGLNP